MDSYSEVRRVRKAVSEAAGQALPGSTAWVIRGAFLDAAFGVPLALLIALSVGMAVDQTRSGR